MFSDAGSSRQVADLVRHDVAEDLGQPRNARFFKPLGDFHRDCHKVSGGLAYRLCRQPFCEKRNRGTNRKAGVVGLAAGHSIGTDEPDLRQVARQCQPPSGGKCGWFRALPELHGERFATPAICR
jgi:hypothetical protein